MRLSKSRFTTGLQCLRELWWDVHEPDAPELVVDDAQQAIFDRGHRVGAAARERFPGGVLIDLPHDALEERVAATRDAMASGATAIFEASFFADDTFVAVDALERTATGWHLVEVKSSTKVKTEHIPDVAIQVHVLRASGLQVHGADVMHLNRQCVFPDLGNLFTRSDVMPEVQDFLPRVPPLIAAQSRMLDGPIPAVAIGPHCESPYACPFQSRCWPAWPEHHVRTLYYIGRASWQLAAQGYTTIAQLPEGLLLHPAARRQIQAVRSGRRVVEPSLHDALSALEPPLAVIDFETVAPAIPVWAGCRPYDAVPVQFSCHAQNANGAWVHHAWIADGPGDPRPEFIARLSAACQDACTIVAYYSPFESSVLARVGQALPQLDPPVQGILSRLVDAQPLVRDHVYDLGFGGGFGLKQVLPALIPEMSYQGLAIADGQDASRQLERLLLGDPPVPPEERAVLHHSLAKYCALDTLGVVHLLEKLRELADGAATGG